MNSTCPICGLDDCKRQDPQCIEHWNQFEIIVGEDLYPSPVDYKSQLDAFLASKTPEVRKFAELVEAASEESKPLLVEELERLSTKQKNPGWLNQYIDLLVNGTHNQSSAAKELGVAQCQVSNFFGKNNLRNLQTLIMQRNRFSTQNDLEAELMRRVMSGKSDNLLMFKLKQLDPSYRDNHQVIVNNNNLTQWNLEIE